MIKSEFTVLWNLHVLHLEAVEKYREHGYDWRERIIPKASKDSSLVNSERNRHATINYRNWHERWEKKVITCLHSLPKDAASLEFKFVNIDLGEWTDTSANRFEKQILALGQIYKNSLASIDVTSLFRVAYSDRSKTLLIALRRLHSPTIKSVRFNGMPLAHDLLKRVCKTPKDDHDVFELLEDIDHAEAESFINGNRKAYNTCMNVNKKIHKEINLEEFLCFKGRSVWINERYL